MPVENIFEAVLEMPFGGVLAEYPPIDDGLACPVDNMLPLPAVCVVSVEFDMGYGAPVV